MSLVLRYMPSADDALTALEADTGRGQLADHIKQALRRIAADPGHTAVRRRRYDVDDQILFGVVVRTGDDDLLILWEPDPDGPIVYYLGPDL